MEQRKKWFAILGVLLLLGVGGYIAYKRFYVPRTVTQEVAVETATVEQGDIVLSALGSGTLLPSEEAALGFETTGKLKDVLVDVGDWVEEGDVLAHLDDTDAKLAMSNAEINLRIAELELEDLQGNASSAEVASARANLNSAQVSLKTLQQGLTETEAESARIDLESAKQSLDQAKNQLYQAQISRDSTAGNAASSSVQKKSAEASVLVAEISVGKAEGAYEQAQLAYNQLLSGATEEELAAAKAKVASAQASLASLSTDAVTLEKAELAVEQARTNLESAQSTLTATTLVASISGVVLSQEGEIGETVGEDVNFITIGNMESPVVCFWLEEQDLLNAVEGNSVSITFEALPSYTFSGKITNVEPALVTVDNTSAVQLWASIDLTGYSSVDLFSGMTAEVEVVTSATYDALLVPLQALRELSEGQYAVFVVGSNGELEMRQVEVGLQDYLNAEILSGLELGEVVRVGEGTESATTSKSEDDATAVPGGGGPGGGMPMDGGGGMPPMGM
ncbi:MAG: efflux RND transporter periplasmic adaptor subunit [Anaerolineae bacterium]|nr:efflux RND transporter periplasmic adaptor subunit [Anaerolineae bacterium]